MAIFFSFAFFIFIGIACSTNAMDISPKKDYHRPPNKIKNSHQLTSSEICINCLSKIKNNLMKDTSDLVDHQIEIAVKSAGSSSARSCNSKELCLEISRLYQTIPLDQQIFDKEILPMIQAVKQFTVEFNNNFQCFKFLLRAEQFRDIKIVFEKIQHFTKTYENFQDGIKREYIICTCEFLLSDGNIKKIMPYSSEMPYLILFDKAFSNFHGQCLMPFDLLHRLKKAFEHYCSSITSSGLDCRRKSDPNNQKKTRDRRASSTSEEPKDKIIAEINTVLKNAFSMEGYYSGKRGEISFHSADMVKATEIIKTIAAYLKESSIFGVKDIPPTPNLLPPIPENKGFFPFIGQ